MTVDQLLAACRWIVFDVTGTLLTPDPPAAEVYRQAAQRYGHQIALSTVQSRFRAAVVRHYAAAIAPAEATEAAASQAVAAQCGPAAATAGDRSAGEQLAGEEAVERLRWRRIVAETLAELEPARADEAFHWLWDHFAEPGHWRLVDGAGPLIGRLLDQQRQLAIATNLDDRVHRLLDGHPPLQKIGRRFLSSHIGWAKPDRRFFDHVAAALGVSPEQILMVGDDEQNDLAGSRRAGWQAVAIDELLRFDLKYQI